MCVFISSKLSIFRRLSIQERLLLFMSAHYWADKMDHVVSSLILSPSFFLCPLDPLRPEAQGSLETCHVTFGCQRSVRRSKGAPVHISWKCRKAATSSETLWMMSGGSAVRTTQPRANNWRKWRRLRARFLGGQNSRAPSFQWAKRFSPGWKSPDTQSRNTTGQSQVCTTQTTNEALFHLSSL